MQFFNMIDQVGEKSVIIPKHGIVIFLLIAALQMNNKISIQTQKHSILPQHI